MAKAEAIILPLGRGGKSPRQLQQLPDEEVVALAKDGDGAAMEYLLRKFKSIVLRKVRSYFALGMDRDDMIQEGMIGLCQAICNFRLDKAASFRTFVDVCITRQMITAVKSGLRGKHRVLNQAVSLDTQLSDADEIALDRALVNPCQLGPADIVTGEATERVLRRRLRAMLSDFEWRVAIRYSRGDSYQEICDELGCTHKQVDNALMRLRRKGGKHKNKLLSIILGT